MIGADLGRERNGGSIVHLHFTSLHLTSELDFPLLYIS